MTDYELAYLRAAERIAEKGQQDMQKRYRRMLKFGTRRRMKAIARSTSYQRGLNDAKKIMREVCRELAATE